MNKHWLAGACMAVMIASASRASAQSAEKLSFGPGQPVPLGNVVKGQHVFDAICWACHSHDLSGGKAPPLTGPKFYAVWQGKSADALFNYIRNSMPRDDPGSLSEPMARDVVAYIVARANKPADSTGAQAGK